MTYINTHVSDINKLVEAYIIFDDSLKVSPRQFVWSRNQGIVAFLNYTNEFFFQERNPFHNFFTRNFL